MLGAPGSALAGISAFPVLLGATRAVSPPTVSPALGLTPRLSCSSPLDASPSPRDSPAAWRIRSEGSHVTLVGPTQPVQFRIQGFSPSLRFAPPSALQVCFAPLTPFSFALQGFPLLGSGMALQPDLLSRRFSVAAHPSSRMTGPPAHRTNQV